ncbi:MAG TPA: PAS domain S-box protein, partial [Caldilineaceae bacterium]|nr:PAS domain S-box protein [Caldilineaceae bacterium]
MQFQSYLLGLAAGLLVMVVGFGLANRISEEHAAEYRAQVLRLSAQQGYLLRREIDRSLAAASALAAVLQETDGQFAEFDGLAAQLMDTFGSVSSVQLAPNGVIRAAYPPGIAAQVVGMDLMADPRGKQAVTRAIIERRLALAGPLDLSTGARGWVAYRPVFVTDSGGQEHFWGLALVVMTLEDLISATGIDRFDRSGYDFALTHLPDNGGEPTVFLRSTIAPVEPVEIPLDVPNGRWTLAVAPEGGWPEPGAFGPDRALILALAGLVGYIVFEVLRRPQQLREQIARRTHELADANLRLLHEVTSRETAQAALTSVLDAVGDGVVATNESGRIIMANRQIETIFGHRPDEVLGKRLGDLLPTYAPAPAIGNSIQGSKDFGEPNRLPLGCRVETTGRHKSGRRFPVEVYIAETVIGGKVHYTASVRDITRQKELER